MLYSILDNRYNIYNTASKSLSNPEFYLTRRCVTPYLIVFFNKKKQPGSTEGFEINIFYARSLHASLKPASMQFFMGEHLRTSSTCTDCGHKSTLNKPAMPGSLG
uniref:Uncharacterized protein n=1 Tax=Opuntia streptacantha TaxID=393608 RepID=A0A7C9EIV7_OPUST